MLACIVLAETIRADIPTARTFTLLMETHKRETESESAVVAEAVLVSFQL